MTDIEMIHLCAEAMGYTIIEVTGDGAEALPKINALRDGISRAMILYKGELMFDRYGFKAERICVDEERYNPLNDDAQAMALVKRFQMDITRHLAMDKSVKGSWETRATIAGWDRTKNENLNRAICECAAKCQQYLKANPPSKHRESP